MKITIMDNGHKTIFNAVYFYNYYEKTKKLEIIDENNIITHILYLYGISFLEIKMEEEK